jgi:hypothetical protein
MLSCAQTQNVIDGKKRIILNPTPELRSGLDTVTFAEGDIWGIDILVASNEDGKVRSPGILPPLKLTLSIGQGPRVPHDNLPARDRRYLSTEAQGLTRDVFGCPKEGGTLPVHNSSSREREACTNGCTRSCSARTAATVRCRVSESQHFMAATIDIPCVSYTPENSVVAAFHFTLALLPGGPSLISAPPVWYKAEKLKTEKELEDEELKGLIGKKLRDSKKKKNKKAGEDGAEEKAEAE